jgi:hypothetical protein
LRYSARSLFDNLIAEHVLRVFTALNIPVLCVHDGFIINYNRGAQLKTVMNTAARSVVGAEINLSNNYMGLDEVEEERKKGYRSFRSLERTEGYLGRKRLFMLDAN